MPFIIPYLPFMCHTWTYSLHFPCVSRHGHATRGYIDLRIPVDWATTAKPGSPAAFRNHGSGRALLTSSVVLSKCLPLGCGIRQCCSWANNNQGCVRLKSQVPVSPAPPCQVPKVTHPTDTAAESEFWHICKRCVYDVRLVAAHRPIIDLVC